MFKLLLRSLQKCKPMLVAISKRFVLCMFTHLSKCLFFKTFSFLWANLSVCLQAKLLLISNITALFLCIRPNDAYNINNQWEKMVFISFSTPIIEKPVSDIAFKITCQAFSNLLFKWIMIEGLFCGHVIVPVQGSNDFWTSGVIYHFLMKYVACHQLSSRRALMIDVKRCFVESQKGAIAVQSIWW